jgi:hypothetical protein
MSRKQADAPDHVVPGVVASEPAAEDLVVGEPRWHMASAVVAVVVLTILMPDDLRFGPNWLLP